MDPIGASSSSWPSTKDAALQRAHKRPIGPCGLDPMSQCGCGEHIPEVFTGNDGQRVPSDAWGTFGWFGQGGDHMATDDRAASTGAVTQRRPDWEEALPDWECRLVGPVSGRYEGAGDNGNAELELRVDIDLLHPYSLVCNVLSGDFFDIDRSWGPPWRVYRASWIVDRPAVATWDRCHMEIEGRVRYWHGSYPTTDVRVRIPWGRFTAAGPAEVVFTEAGGVRRTFICPLVSENFRDVTLEVDVCQRASLGPELPVFDTHDHIAAPAHMPRGTITLESAFQTAGIGVTVNDAGRTDIDDSHVEFSSWSSAEIHDAMETYFSRYGRGLPWSNWHLWSLLAERHDQPGYMGVMFDASVDDGAYTPPDRQGFAIFRGHGWFQDLPVGPPVDEDQATALRLWLFVWVHEAGHAFNLMHSWDKGRPRALSWMNYAWNNPWGEEGFWRRFWFRFDPEEILHLRHGDRMSVVMGGDPFGTGAHAEAHSVARAVVEGQAPLEVLVRSKGSFDLMEDVCVEIRLRNQLAKASLPVDTRLSPEEGRIAVYIRRPNGRTLEYTPVLCAVSTPDLRELQPAGAGEHGSDRYSTEISLTYGKDGFIFDQPGEYLIRAVYRGLGTPVPSPVHRIRVLGPHDAHAARLVPRFFSTQVGLAVALGGSASPYLGEGMETLATLAERYPDEALGARAAMLVARTEARPFFRIEDSTVVQHKEARRKEALALADSARQFFKGAGPAMNLAYHALVRERAAILAGMGDHGAADQEWQALKHDLEANGVNPSVLREIASSDPRNAVTNEQQGRGPAS